MNKNTSSFIRHLVLGSLILGACTLASVEQAWAPPFKLPVVVPGPIFTQGSVIVDTLLAQQTGRPNAIRKIGFVSGTDSLEIGYVSVIANYLSTGTGTMRISFYPLSGRLHDADPDDVATIDLVEVEGTGSTQFSLFGIGEPNAGFNTIVFENLSSADMSITFYTIVY